MPDIQSTLGLREQMSQPDMVKVGPGPFVTISREYGCPGLQIALLVAEVMNTEESPAGPGWQVYGHEVLEQLSKELHLEPEVLRRLEHRAPHILAELYNSMATAAERLPSGYRVRRRLRAIVRHLTIKGHAIVLGHGSAGITADIPNGMRVSLEAPLEWRVGQLAFDEGLSHAEAHAAVEHWEKEHEFLRQVYRAEYHRRPLFDLTYDCSRFTPLEIAKHVACMLKLRRMT